MSLKRPKLHNQYGMALSRCSKLSVDFGIYSAIKTTRQHTQYTFYRYDPQWLLISNNGEVWPGYNYKTGNWTIGLSNFCCPTKSSTFESTRKWYLNKCCSDCEEVRTSMLPDSSEPPVKAITYIESKTNDEKQKAYGRQQQQGDQKFKSTASCCINTCFNIK